MHHAGAVAKQGLVQSIISFSWSADDKSMDSNRIKKERKRNPQN
jgi:hypothetical protein